MTNLDITSFLANIGRPAHPYTMGDERCQMIFPRIVGGVLVTKEGVFYQMEDPSTEYEGDFETVPAEDYIFPDKDIVREAKFINLEASKKEVDVSPFAANIGKRLPDLITETDTFTLIEPRFISGVVLRDDGVFYEIQEGEESSEIQPVSNYTFN